MRRLALLTCLSLLGCPTPSRPDGGGGTDGGAPQISSLSPEHGPIEGGTTVTVNGSGFAEGCSVLFGNFLGGQVVVSSSRKLTVVTPAATAGGKVSVRVSNPDGQFGVLADGFTYDGTVGPQPIDEAVISNPLLATDESGAAQVTLNIAAQVSAPGRTSGDGQGQGVKAQVGWVIDAVNPPAESFTWVDATYVRDADGANAGDKGRDVYAADVTVPGASGMTEHRYALGARFSIDDGATWTFADHDGAANGVSDDQIPRYVVGQRAITWCKLGGEQVEPPPMLTLRVGQTGPTIYGQVYLMGITDQSGAGPGIVGQLGHGRAAQQPAQWAWVDAAFNHDTGNGANDEFQAVLPVVAGDERFAFRFAVNGGPWRYCDADGLATGGMGGFTDDQTGKLDVRQVGIDECRLQYPLTLTSMQGQPAGPVYGRVTAQGVTDQPGATTGMEAQFGFGPQPDPSNAAWTWANASYNVESENGSEEYQASFSGPAPGAYFYAYRFRYQMGAWRYCDADPTDNTITQSQLGALTATAFTPMITACRLQYVSSTSCGSGDEVTAFGRVLVPSLTATAGATPNLRGQVGVGTAGDNASASTTWGWREAAFYGDLADAGGAEEFSAKFHPAYSGSRAVSFRFSLDDGGTWSYCDVNGSENGGYEVGQQWGLTVGQSSAMEYCSLQFPDTITQAADGGTIVYGQIYIGGVTPNPGGDPSVVAELGYGKKVEDPGTAASWVWKPATFNPNCTSCGGNNDEYQAAFSAPPGSWAYAWRFSRVGSTSYCFGDFDGNGSTTGTGFNGERPGNDNLGAATVTP